MLESREHTVLGDSSFQSEVIEPDGICAHALKLPGIIEGKKIP